VSFTIQKNKLINKYTQGTCLEKQLVKKQCLGFKVSSQQKVSSDTNKTRQLKSAFHRG